MAAAGSAIGVGSLWRFPFIVGENGGGAFVLLYLFFTFAIGLPVFIAELIVGRRSQKSALFAYSDLSGKNKWRFIGWLNLLSCLIILSFYAVVSGWGVSYTLMSLTQFTKGLDAAQISGVFDTLFTSGDINLLFLFLFLLINVGVVYAGVRKGIEKWSKILMPMLLALLLGLFCYSVTLDGFGQAVEFVLYPNFDKVTPTTVLSALGMAFFTLSVALGIILTYGSYMQRTEDIPRTAGIVALMTVLVSLLSALMIFPIVFTFGYTPAGGPGLVFKTMPVLFSKLPGTLILSTLFFTLFVFTALTSSISLMEMLASNIIEYFNIGRKKATLLVAGAAFILGIPSALSGSGTLFAGWKKIYGMDFFSTMDFITSSWFMPVAGLLTTFFVGWALSRKVTQEEFTMGARTCRWYLPWLFAVRFVAPIVVILIILQEAGVLVL